MPLAPSQYHEAPTAAERLALCRQYLSELMQKAAAESTSYRGLNRSASGSIGQLIQMVRADLNALETVAGGSGQGVVFRFGI